MPFTPRIGAGGISFVWLRLLANLDDSSRALVVCPPNCAKILRPDNGHISATGIEMCRAEVPLWC